ncbi:UDP-glucose 4-epimerase GalE [Desulfovibrio inopinatus]|uniref:UDP-glucose 4-epimerase GalE n=1 Tax=Desulfovibrio inopinatus TaxID=102109 RepID=UPI000413F43A|nr:UDP-glucose 4-epimerase GalE [Desulfovibrio inopinatus]
MNAIQTKPTILIVGGAGYIGSHINCALNERGYNTIIFDNLVYGHESFVQWGKFILGDLADKNQLRLLFSQYKIDAVMHFAAYAYVGESVTDPYKYYINNVANTLNLLEVMQEFDVKTLVFSSTCAVYGTPQEIPITENHPQNPINPYGRTKLMMEHIMADAAQAYGLGYAALRYFNAAGADPGGRIGEWHDPETHLIPLVLEAARDQSRSITVFGTDYETPDGTCIRDYIHVNDLSSAHCLALDHLFDQPGEYVFNLGNGQGFSVKEIIDSAREITGRGINVIYGQRRPGDPAKLVGNAQKMLSTLNWTPQSSSIKTILQTAWDWLQVKEQKYKT